jgi:hypothetical protein
MAINIGVFPKSHRTDKFGRSYKVKNGQVLTRGPNVSIENCKTGGLSDKNANKSLMFTVSFI